MLRLEVALLDRPDCRPPALDIDVRRDDGPELPPEAVSPNSAEEPNVFVGEDGVGSAAGVLFSSNPGISDGLRQSAPMPYTPRSLCLPPSTVSSSALYRT